MLESYSTDNERTNEGAAVTDSMFSLDSVPWMKLGKLTSTAATAEEAITQSALNFTVSATPSLFRTPDGELREHVSRFTTYRDDTLEPLGVVSDVYEVVQYADAFTFMNEISPQFVAAGSLNDGRQGFMVVQVPDVEFRPLGEDDPHTLYAVLRTSHNRTRGIEVCALPLRHRCMNQLALPSFSAEAPLRWSIRHTKNAPDRLKEATYTLSHLASYAAEYEKLAERLAKIKLVPGHAEEIISKYVLPPWVKKRDEVTANILGMLADERVGDEYANTGWGLVQAVSTYYEHVRPGGTPQSRLLGALDGQTVKAVTKTTNVLQTRYAALAA